MKHDVVIIGAGIVGLATGLKILEQRPGTKLTILDKEKDVAQHQTGHNSGVIHSGIYYKPGGLRAKNCIRGYDMMLEFCKQHDIAYEICGKVIVATREKELPSLQTVYERGVANGLDGIKMISPEELKEIEPHVFGVKAIWVPQAGIVDYGQVARKYRELIEAKGGEIVLGAKADKVLANNGSSEVITTDGRNFQGELVINCAGLYSDKLAEQTHENLDMKILPFRGEYYEIKKEKEYLINNLVYPAPDPDFPWLGVHFTRMIHGGIEAGPNAVLAFRREGYKKLDVHWGELMETLGYKGFRKMARKFWRQGLDEYKRSFSKRAFTTSLQKLLPEIQMEDLVPGGAGVRALALGDDGSLLDDFVFFDDKQVINVCNAPSPAATSSLSIGQTVSEMALKKFN